MAQFDDYKANGSAAYDIFSVRESTARPLERPERLPDAPAQNKPVEKVRVKLAFSPFTVVSTMVVVVMLFLVVFSYVRMYETKSVLSNLQNTRAELVTQQQALKSQYESSIDYEAVEERALALGMHEPTASQITYVQVSAADQTEVYAAPEERNFLQQVYDAFAGVFADVKEYFS